MIDRCGFCKKEIDLKTDNYASHEFSDGIFNVHQSCLDFEEKQWAKDKVLEVKND
jgi:hypothetical protein